MPSSRKANQPHFVFICGQLDASTFGVATFSGTDEVSTPYAFNLQLRSPRNDIASTDMINKQATLYIFRDGEYMPYSGIVSEFAFSGTNVDYSTYSVKLVPRLWLLTLNKQTRVFQKMSVTEILEKVFETASLSDYYTLDMQGSYPQREYIVQYQESDFDFISRLMEGCGIFYFFKELPLLEEEIGTVNQEALIISDKAASFETISGDSEIVYRSGSGLNERVDSAEKESVSVVAYEEHMVSKEVHCKNYNYRTPEVDLSSHKVISSGHVGTVYTYGEEFLDTDSAQKAATLAADRISSSQITVSGESNCRGMRAGFRFTLKEHFRDDCNDQYMIRMVIHTGSHTAVKGAGVNFSYKNNFSLLPSSLVDKFRPQLKTRVPTINGVITAMIETNGSDYASLDETGRYKVRLPFDLSDSQNYDASKYIRLSQPYAGSNYGMHFPSHEGTEMVLACIDGNPNRPIGLGTVPNANTVSPVVSNNKAQNIIRTAGSNELCMDDTADKQKIHLMTAAKNIIKFDDENRNVFVQTTDGNKLLMDDKNEKSVWNAKDHNMTMSYKSGEEGVTITTGKGHVFKIDDAKKKLTIQTSAGHIIEMDDGGKTITLTDCKGKNTVTLDGSKGLILDSQGEISIKAMKDINIEGSNIKISASTGKIDIKAMQDLTLGGMKINEKATMDFNMEGMNANIKAQMQAKVEANMGVEIKSSLQTKVSGTMTELSGQAMTTVKGAIVMIN